MEQITKSRKARQSKYKCQFTSDLAYRWCMGAWSSLNQRAVNGKYSNSESVTSNPQQISYHKKGRTLSVGKDEFFNWASSQENLIDSIYASGDRPNVDRVKEDGNYDLSNMQIISSKENRLKRNLKSGVIYPYELKYGKLYATVVNRKKYLSNMTDKDVKEKPFDTLILTLPPSIVCKIILKSREEMQDDVDDTESLGFGPCSLYMGDA